MLLLDIAGSCLQMAAVVACGERERSRKFTVVLDAHCRGKGINLAVGGSC